MSSATYLINDVRDLDSDRRHPRKRRRPVAAGELTVRTALAAAVGLALTAVLMAALVRSALVLVVLGYLALTLSYTTLWREVVVMDLLLIAGGFVFRAVAGGAAVGVSLSSSFLVVTSAGALFLIIGKRLGELACAGQTARGTLDAIPRVPCGCSSRQARPSAASPTPRGPSDVRTEGRGFRCRSSPSRSGSPGTPRSCAKAPARRRRSWCSATRACSG